MDKLVLVDIYEQDFCLRYRWGLRSRLVLCVGLVMEMICFTFRQPLHHKVEVDRHRFS